MKEKKQTPKKRVQRQKETPFPLDQRLTKSIRDKNYKEKRKRKAVLMRHLQKLCLIANETESVHFVCLSRISISRLTSFLCYTDIREK